MNSWFTFCIVIWISVHFMPFPLCVNPQFRWLHRSNQRGSPYVREMSRLLFFLPLFCSLLFCARISSKGVEIIVVVSSVAPVFSSSSVYCVQLCFCSLLDAILAYKHGYNRCMRIQKRKKNDQCREEKTFFAFAVLAMFSFMFSHL